MDYLCNLCSGFQVEYKLNSNQEVWSFLKSVGFDYVPNYIKEDVEIEIINELDEGIWRKDLDRRVQIFGQQYNFVKCYMDLKEPMLPYPKFERNQSTSLIERTFREKITPIKFNQISLINFKFELIHTNSK